MNDMNLALETLLLCQSIGGDERDIVERALDEGYDSLAAEDKSKVRRLLNRQSAGGGGALRRYRQRRTLTMVLGAAPRAQQAASSLH